MNGRTARTRTGNTELHKLVGLLAEAHEDGALKYPEKRENTPGNSGATALVVLAERLLASGVRPPPSQ